ncbi:flagellar basal body-associated protein FliL [Flocculibacter collagenilyticus]|uniref:flagellar basal body-associated protein FliL n=1 Tax=Flocculibacter collagenilyticus TaxID=2744479 RepID=UPI0018F51607|nr:flagellar basal body-associated protein FliL [Flocculibacter collagenilyticus]
MKHLTLSIVAAIILFFTPPSSAQDSYAYYGFEPDIITNYISSGKKIGYVRVTVELMLKDVSYLPIVEHHAPLLRDAIIDIISKEPESKAKSLVGREEIRAKTAQRLKEILTEETGQELIKEVLFTKYLYH